MSSYYFPSLHKGLVDGSAKGKLDKDYKSKCAELENCYIKSNKNIASRPPLKQTESLDIEGTLPILDLAARDGKTYLLRNIDNPSNTDFQNSLFTKLNSWFDTLDIGTERAPLFINFTFGTGSASRISNAWQIVYNIEFNGRLIETFNEQGQRINEESYLICHIRTPIDLTSMITNVGLSSAQTYSPTDLSDTRVQNISQLLLLFGRLEEEKISGLTVSNSTRYDSDTPPTGTNIYTPDITTENSPFRRQAQYCNDAGELEYVFIFKNPFTEYNPIYEGVSNLPGLDLSFPYVENGMRSNINAALNRSHLEVNDRGFMLGNGAIQDQATLFLFSAAYDFYVNEELINFQPHFSNDVSLPTSFEDRQQGIGLSLFGLDYTLDNVLICDQSGSSSLTSVALEDNNMNKFTEQSIDLDFDGSEILVTEFPTYLREPIAGFISEDSTFFDTEVDSDYRRSVNPIIREGSTESFNSFVNNNPELADLKNLLIPALTILNQTDNGFPNSVNTIESVLDIKIPSVGSDLPTEGTFLFSTALGDNVFVGASAPIYYDTFQNTADQTAYDEGNQPTHADNPNIIDESGNAYGSLGVTIYIQRNNPVAENGVPIYTPIPAPDSNDVPNDLNIGIAEGPFVITNRVLTLHLDYSNPDLIDTINRIKYASFYNSAGRERGNVSGLVKVSNMFVIPDWSDRLNACFKYNVLAPTSQLMVADANAHLILDMKKELDITNLGAQYASNKLISYSPDFQFKHFNIAADSTNYSNKDLTTEIDRFKTVGGNNYSTVQWLGNADVNNYLYPLNADAVNAMASRITNLETALAQAENIKNELLQTRRFVGNINNISRRNRTEERIFNDGRVYDRGANTVTNFNELLNRPFTLRLWTGDVVHTNIFNYLSNDNLSYISNASTGGGEVILTYLTTVTDTTQLETDNRVWSDNIYGATNSYKIEYDAVYIYVHDKNTTRSIANDPLSASGADTINLNRNTISDYIIRLNEALGLAKRTFSQLLIEQYFYPYSTYFKIYNEPNDKNIRLNQRFLQAEDNNFHFSNRTIGKEQEFSVGGKEFINNNFAASKTPEYIRRSGLAIDINDIELNFNDPQILRILGKYDEEVIATNQVILSDHNIIITNQGIYSITDTIQGLVLDRVSDAGMDTEVVVDSSLLIGGLGDKIKVVKYSEQTRGYVDNIVNDEYRLPGKITSVASVLPKHKQVLFSVENNLNEIYALSVSDNQEIHGLAKFTFDASVEIVKLVTISDDKVLLLLRNGKVLELDFNDVDTFSENVVTVPDNIDGTEVNYTQKIRTMPVLQLDSRDFSPNKIMNVQKVIFGLTGSPNCDISIVNSLTGKKVTKNVANTTTEDITEITSFSGQFLVDGLQPNGGQMLEVLIEKDDGLFMELSSITLIGDF